MQVLKQREHEELEDALQHLVALASAPAPFAQDFATFTTAKLLQKLGCDAATTTASQEATTKTTTANHEKGRDDPTTLLLLQRRLNSEYRFLAAQKRTEHEKALSAETLKFQAKEKSIRDEHVQTLKSIAASSGSDAVTIPKSKAPSTNAVVVLERQLIERISGTPSRASSVADTVRTKAGGGAGAGGDGGVWDATTVDPATRKLIAFWKARYQAAARQLEDVAAELSMTEAKCAQQVELRGADVETVERMISILQDAEGRERMRLAANRTEYLEACRRFGVEPRTDVEDETGLVTFDPVSRSFVTTTSKAVPPTAGTMLLSTLAREQRRRNDEMRNMWEELGKRIEEQSAHCDSLLELLAEQNGTAASDGSVHIAEELIVLLSQIDMVQRKSYDRKAKWSSKEVERCTLHRERVETLETRRWTLCEAVERHRCELRALDVKLLTVTGATHGTNEVLEDESAVLQSKIALLENELSLLRSEKKELEAVGNELERQVQQRMQSHGLKASVQ